MFVIAFGSTALARMPCAAPSSATVRHNPTIPALAAA
jgi:hypothetical protein